MGHSEGALIAALGAARSSEVAFIILLAPPMLPIDQIPLAQEAAVARAHEEDEATIERQRASSTRLITMAKAATDVAAFRSAVDGYLAAEPDLDAAAKAALARYANRLASPWMRWLLAYDPLPDLARVRCPVLALIGEKDLQVVPVEGNLAALRQGLIAGGNTRLVTRVLPGLNHAFQTARTGSPVEYGVIEETMAPQALHEIGAWMRVATNAPAAAAAKQPRRPVI